MLQLAFDIGGTFTDLVLLDTEKGDLRIWKVPTTPDAPERAVAQALCVHTRAAFAISCSDFPGQ